jgi:superfamily II DNA helicase RecQ
LFRKIRNEINLAWKESEQTLDDHENNLLSWSFLVLKKNARQKHPVAHHHQSPLQAEQLPSVIELTFLGRFYKPGQQYEIADPDTHASAERRVASPEVIKICPKQFDGQIHCFYRPAGFRLPPLRFGERFTLENFEVENFRETGQKLVPQIPYSRTTIIPHENWDGVSPGKNNRGFLEKYDRNTQEAINEIAYRLFGFSTMRRFQHQILERVLTGRSILGVAATGGGKSECFILPALLLPGVTIVVSPLKSLMYDQYHQRLSSRYGLSDLATIINGDIKVNERQRRLGLMESGYYKLVYFTPEQLERGYILESLKRTDEKVGIRYLAVDEAHCISQWGHDFRPSYLNMLHRFQDYEIRPTIIALTATASMRVREDICHELQLIPRSIENGGDIFVDSSNRPELNLIVRIEATPNEKAVAILDELKVLRFTNRKNKNPGAALIFMPHTGGDPDDEWRWETDQESSESGKYSAGVTPFAAWLERKLHERVTIYHSKMKDQSETSSDTHPNALPFGNLSERDRQSEQERFINGVSQIMVATKGFGMGIDKPNIRLVIHRTPPSNMESYAQEAGRAGRDGEFARALLFYNPKGNADDDGEPPGNEKNKSDYRIQEFFINKNYIRREDILAVGKFLLKRQHPIPTRMGNDQPIIYYYFTFDEILAYLESINYDWPDFSPRSTYVQAYGKHADILDKGHIYNEKLNHIDKILAAIIKIRPNLSTGKSQAFLESCQETGAAIFKFKYFNWEGIIGSNLYFGEFLRAKGVTKDDFLSALTNDTLIPFAIKLGISLTDLTQMLTDIKSAENQYGRRLLTFSFIKTPLWGSARGKEELLSWLDYAGAYKRAKYNEAHAQAKQKNIADPMIEHWFRWREAARTKGWEILPGPAFTEESFSEFVDVFMSAHDERKRQDWDAYRRLLTDYIGVNQDGSYSSNQINRRCLRSVLLGYLASGEVIKDGNCYSCSNCVRDENFSKYDKELRASVIVKLSAGLNQLLSQLKEKYDSVPDETEVSGLFTMLNTEKEKGFSVLDYFSGWTVNTLDETPGHIAASWLRLCAMLEEILPPISDEMLSIIETFLYQKGTIEKSRLFQRIHQTEALFKNDINALSKLQLLLAKYFEQENETPKSIDYAESVIKNDPHTSFSMEARKLLLKYYEPGNPLANPEKFDTYTQELARHAFIEETNEGALRYYRMYFTQFEKKKFLGEIQWLLEWDTPEETIVNLFGSILLDNQLYEIACEIIEQTKIYHQLPKTDFKQIFIKIPENISCRYPVVINYWVKEHLLPNMPSTPDARREFFKNYLPFLSWQEVQTEVIKHIKKQNSRGLIVDILDSYIKAQEDINSDTIDSYKQEVLEKNYNYLIDQAHGLIKENRFGSAVAYYQEIIKEWNWADLKHQLSIILGLIIDEKQRVKIFLEVIDLFSKSHQETGRIPIETIEIIFGFKSQLSFSSIIDLIQELSPLQEIKDLLIPYIQNENNQNATTYTEQLKMIEVAKLIGERDLESKVHESIIRQNKISEKRYRSHVRRLSILFSIDRLNNRIKCLLYSTKLLSQARTDQIKIILSPYLSFMPGLHWDEIQKDIEFLEEALFEFQIPLVVQRWIIANPNIENQIHLSKYIIQSGLDILDFKYWEDIILTFHVQVLLSHPLLVQHLISSSEIFKEKLDNLIYINKLRSWYYSGAQVGSNNNASHFTWKEICRYQKSEIIFGLNFSIERKNLQLAEAFLDLLLSENEFSHLQIINFALFHYYQTDLPEKMVLFLSFFEKYVFLLGNSDISTSKKITDHHLSELIEAFCPEPNNIGQLLTSIFLDELSDANENLATQIKNSDSKSFLSLRIFPQEEEMGFSEETISELSKTIRMILATWAAFSKTNPA